MMTNSGKITEVFMSSNVYKKRDVEYDQSSFISLKTDKGIFGRVSQDIFTYPAIKMARIQFEDKNIEWYCNQNGKYDMVKYLSEKNINNKKFYKSRPDDFIQELMHISSIKNSRDYEKSPIKLQNALDSIWSFANILQIFKKRIYW